MYKKFTQSIVNQMESGTDLVPVHSILDHEHFRPRCLVVRQRKNQINRSLRYGKARFSLDDVLLPAEDNESTESLRGGRQTPTQFTVTKTVSDRVDGKVSANFEPVSGEVTAAISSSKEWSIKLKKNEAPVQELEALATKRKINMKHNLIRQLQKRKQRLYVVYETIENSEEATYQESREAGGGLMAQIYAKFCVKGSRENKQSITVPKGCTLAFRVIPLVIEEDGSWYLDCFSEQNRSLLESDGFSTGELGKLEPEIEYNCHILPKLPLDVSIKLLEAIKAAMRDTNLFRELTQKVDEVLCGIDSCEQKTENPELRDLLGTLQHSQKQLQTAKAIAYTLDALDELTEDQLLLLLESLEEKIVPQQLKLVTSILEHDIEKEKGNFKVDARLLSFSGEKEQELTIAMVGMSGVMLQKDGSVVCEEDAISATAALYVSLYVLSLLSK